MATVTSRGALHHVEIWVADFAEAESSLGWLLEQLGYQRGAAWPDGASWTHGVCYLVIEAGGDVSGDRHDRMRPGVNHLAFHAGSAAQVDALAVAAEQHGWSVMFADAHPYAGGPDHYAAYLENAAGFEVELVADPA